MTAEICLVAPYEQLSDVARSVRDSSGHQFDIEIANLEDALALLPRLEGEGYQALVCRGKTAQLLRQHTRLPVIDIKISSFDILRVLADLSGKPCRVGFVGYGGLMRDCEKVADLLKIPSYSILFDQDDALRYEALRDDVRRRLEQYPIDLMVGDTIPQSRFGDLCSQFRLISSGIESVQEAIENAQEFLNVLRRERINRDHLSTVLDMFEKAVFSLDQMGRITHANRAAVSIFQMSRTDMMGKPIEVVDPALAIARETIANGIWEVGQMVETRQGRMVCYLYPIDSRGECHSVVFALERVERVYMIEQKIRYQEQQKSKFKAHYHLDDYITYDSTMQTQLALLKSYAHTDATVLITGESGTGKELLAQGIHNASRRAEGPFVAVNCGALPPTLLESELFGYVDGAFTGASRKGKKGLFELANKGTLFLDEIGELDKPLQTRLLRVIQERQLMRLGSEQIIPVDIRIVAATNEDLEAMVDAGTFRQDLFYRLNVLKFETLPLRLRPQDIISSAITLLRKHARTYQSKVVDLDRDVRRMLLGYHWPGNFRQLSNVMERIAIIATNPVVSLADIQPAMVDLRKSARGRKVDCAGCELTEGNLDTIRSRIIAKIVAEEDNSRTRAARRLGVDRSTLTRWLKDSSPELHSLSSE